MLYIHKFNPNIYVGAEAVRVYELLDLLIPRREGFLHNHCYEHRVMFLDESRLKGLPKKELVKRVIEATIKITPDVIVTDDWEGNIGTCEKDWPIGKINEREYLLKVKYDTRKKGQIVIETSEIDPDELEERLAA